MNLHMDRIVLDTEGVNLHIKYLTFTLDVEGDEDACWFVDILHDLKTSSLHIWQYHKTDTDQIHTQKSDSLN